MAVLESYAFDATLTKQAFRTDQEEERRQHIREPVLDSAADLGSDVDLGELLRGADQESAHDRSGHGGEASENQDGERFQRREGQRELDPGARSPEDPGDQR